MDKVMEIACKYNLYVIEDATESLGSLYKDKPTGTLGHIGCFSFNGNKLLILLLSDVINMKTIAVAHKSLVSAISFICLLLTKASTFGYSPLMI